MTEAPHMPTRDEILDKALEIFFKENPDAPTPEEEELKEGSYWERARQELMTGFKSQLEAYLAYLEEETAKTREALGVAPPPPPPRLEELELQLSTLRERYETTKRRLKEAEEEIERIRAAKPPSPPPPPPMGLTPEEKTRLEDAFKRIFIEAGADWRGSLPALRDESHRLQEELRDIPRPRAFEVARTRIEDLARRLLPPPRPWPEIVLPPIPAIITLPEPGVTTYICPIDGIAFISADPDTMYYVRAAMRWFPKEYFEYCPEDQKKLMGWPPLEGIIQEGFEAGILPPVWARWLMRVAEAIKTAKGLPI